MYMLQSWMLNDLDVMDFDSVSRFVLSRTWIATYYDYYFVFKNYTCIYYIY